MGCPTAATTVREVHEQKGGFMPPVHRHHSGTVVAPAALIEAVDNTFGITDGSGPEYGLCAEEVADLEALCSIEHTDVETVTIDAAVLSAARNTLDCHTLSSECEQYDPDTIGVRCHFCVWCQSLIVRDWCDAVLDRGGHPPTNAYLELTPDDYQPADEYHRLMHAA